MTVGSLNKLENEILTKIRMKHIGQYSSPQDEDLLLQYISVRGQKERLKKRLKLEARISAGEFDLPE